LKGNAAAPASSMPLAATGAAWSIVSSPNTSATQDNYLNDVTCTSASDCWAVGSYYNGSVGRTLIEHWNGTTWSIVTSPNTSATQGNGLSGVTCSSASDCWAVGLYNISSVDVDQTLIEHWNGTAWSIVTSPNTSTGHSHHLLGVTCTSPSDCWAVGDYFTGTIENHPAIHTLIERWNGTAWSIVTSPTTTLFAHLREVTCASASDCWAVGDDSNHTLTEHWNGTAWSIVTSPNAIGPNYLNGVTCASASDCWAVGYSFTGGAFQTLIERYSSIGWQISALGDFDRNSKPDYLLYNVSTRRTAVWYMNDNVFVTGAYGPTLPAGWLVIDVADFNGDSNGFLDYALFNPSTRQTAIWYLSEVTFVGAAYGPTLPSGWALVATGDFNGDGNPDYVLYNASTRRTAMWYMNNNVFVTGAYGPTLPAGWSLAGVADFNNDGNRDYLLFNASTRQSAIWYLSGVTFLGAHYGPTIASGYRLQGTADFNGDFQPDYLLFNPSTRRTAIWYLNNNIFNGGAYGPTLP
jgi:hypothetical protein